MSPERPPIDEIIDDLQPESYSEELEGLDRENSEDIAGDQLTFEVDALNDPRRTDEKSLDDDPGQSSNQNSRPKGVSRRGFIGALAAATGVYAAGKPGEVLAHPGCVDRDPHFRQMAATRRGGTSETRRGGDRSGLCYKAEFYW
ncbi:twin-arginine translocation signal domain-containing protein [Patescibacteria group bacterium]|nr:twin-arginine translocation signal domain-containing protein [Patescibacteria group bacterium]